VDLIDLGIGDPDIPTPTPIIERLKRASEDPKNHRYPAYEGTFEFRSAAAEWVERRFGVRLDPGTEVLSLIGSKEGIAHIPLLLSTLGTLCSSQSGISRLFCLDAFRGWDSLRLAPPEGKPFSAKSCGGSENGGREGEASVHQLSNNPTAAIAERSFFEEVVAFANATRLSSAMMLPIRKWPMTDSNLQVFSK